MLKLPRIGPQGLAHCAAIRTMLAGSRPSLEQALAGYSEPVDARERVLAEVDAAEDELVELTRALVRIPTVNPPGAHYADCAELLASRLRAMDMSVQLLTAEDHPDHNAKHPRVNVLGRLQGQSPRPCLHLNGHIDVVPAGTGWSVDPFAGVVQDRKIFGRGTADMKAGVAAAVVAVQALLRAGVRLQGSVEISGSVDEESGGFAGMEWLCKQGYLGAERTDYVIIPEPLNVDRVCVGHRGVYWFEVHAQGKVAHGSMPFLGESAIAHLATLLERVRTELAPRLFARETAMPVVPDAARHASINVNSIIGGQAGQSPQSACVAEAASAVFDRRFLHEESFDAVKAEINALLEQLSAEEPRRRYRLEDMMIVHPVMAPEDSPLVGSLSTDIRALLGRAPTLVASPGTYDHKHVARVAGVPHCVAYGPGILDLAHQVDEYCAIDDLVQATKVIALSVMRLCGTAS